MQKKSLEFHEARGREARKYLEELARLRMIVFRDFPYLYEGDLEYEHRYLDTYFSSDKSFVILALDGKKVVGASTAILLTEEEDAFQKPFREHGIEPSTVCYFGESVLFPEYRGLGAGKKFMQARLNFARQFPQIKKASFCAVIRPEDHPMRPENYRPLDTFWESEGFRKKEGMTTEYHWKDLGQEEETDKPMQFWIKEL
jgi:GNAT superfamily N-acetyltransferase